MRCIAAAVAVGVGVAAGTADIVAAVAAVDGAGIGRVVVLAIADVVRTRVAALGVTVSETADEARLGWPRPSMKSGSPAADGLREHRRRRGRQIETRARRWRHVVGTRCLLHRTHPHHSGHCSQPGAHSRRG